MPLNVSSKETSHEARSAELLLEFQEFVVKVNDRSIPNDAFKQSASQYKLRLDAYEYDLNPVGDSLQFSSLESRSYDDQAPFDGSCQEQHALPLTFDAATSQNTTTSHFSHTKSGDALTEKPKHFQDTEALAKISSTGFEDLGSEDEQEALVKVMTAQAITVQRLPVKEAGPYCINGTHRKTESGYDHGVRTETHYQPGEQQKSEFAQSSTDIDSEALQEYEPCRLENEFGRTSSPSVHHRVRRRHASDISEAGAPGNTASMPRFSWILPRMTDSTLFSDAHIIRLTLLPPTQCEPPAENTGHPTNMLPGPRDSTFLYDADVLHISLYGETTSEREGTGNASCSKLTAANSEKRDSLFLWRNKDIPLEIPVSESCWEAASRLCRVQAETSSPDEHEHDCVDADLHQLEVMIEKELANWL